MKARERVLKTLKFESSDRAPRDLWALPGILQYRQDEYQQVLEKYPNDFMKTGLHYGPAERATPLSGAVGTYRDEWGSVWEVSEPGVIGEVKQPVLHDWSEFGSFCPPTEMLNQAKKDHINRDCVQTDLFVMAGTQIRPFERMQFLRGTENLFLDIAYGCPEFFQLRDMLHEFFLKELDLLLSTDVDALSFLDDWGSQLALLISPQTWREIYKPLYKDYCDRIHGAGKHVFFHSDGHIEAIYPDLIEIGVDAVNSQLFCMDVEHLANQFRGKITFWGEIDRQHILPFGTPEQVWEAVKRIRQLLDTGQGGVIAQCEFGTQDPLENILAVFEAWSVPLDSM